MRRRRVEARAEAHELGDVPRYLVATAVVGAEVEAVHGAGSGRSDCADDLAVHSQGEDVSVPHL